MNIPDTDAHLTYSLNAYPVRNVQDIERAVFVHAEEIKNNIHTLRNDAFGIGLWIPSSVLETCMNEAWFDSMKEKLNTHNMYIFTINGFPYSQFHNTRVKEQVYVPDWTSKKRQDYTQNLADTLSRFLPEGMQGSISTLPLMFGRNRPEHEIKTAVQRLMDTVLYLRKIDAQKKKHIILALEPEPGCFLETTDTVIELFTHIIPTYGFPYIRDTYGISVRDAREYISRYLGICLDIVHAHVMFEQPYEVIRILHANNIKIAKIHIGAALILPQIEHNISDTLSQYNDDVYLHQTVVRDTSGTLHYFQDIPEALQASFAGEWRIHYHLPLTKKVHEKAYRHSHTTYHTLFRYAYQLGVRHFEIEIYTLNQISGLSSSPERIVANEIEYVLSCFN